MKKFKLLLFAAVTILALAVFVGCGTKKDSQDVNTTENNTENDRVVEEKDVDDKSMKDEVKGTDKKVNDGDGILDDTMDSVGEGVKDVGRGVENVTEDVVDGAEDMVNDATRGRDTNTTNMMNR